MDNYLINFIFEESHKEGYIAGRIEVAPEYKGSTPIVDNIRFYTDSLTGFEDFRKRYDYQTVSELELKAIYLLINDEFNEKVS